MDDVDNAEHMFSIVPINSNIEPYPPTLNQVNELPPHHPIKLYFSKEKKVKEEVVFELSFDELKPTLALLLSFLLIQMAGRFTHDELTYFCKELGRDPTFDEFEGRDKF